MVRCTCLCGTAAAEAAARSNVSPCLLAVTANCSSFNLNSIVICIQYTYDCLFRQMQIWYSTTFYLLCVGMTIYVVTLHSLAGG